ncbi:unnamed protein product [Scytosiphon promiscuus]
MTVVSQLFAAVMDHSRGYTFKAGSYIYVNSPMISRNEWHPFSIIQLPGDLPRATFYAEAVGGKGVHIKGNI